MFIASFTSLILMCALICCKSLGRSVPCNYFLMTTFTLCEAYIVSYICASVNDPKVVIAAAFFTAAIVLSLTVYAFTTKKDFTVFGGLAFMISIGLLIFGIVCAFLGPQMYLIYCFLSVCAFGFYLIIDTQMVVGQNKYELETDDYIIGAIILYVDIVNIFIYLVQIFGNLCSKEWMTNFVNNSVNKLILNKF